MRLSELLREIPGAVPLDPGDPEVRGVECDTRALGPGHLFAAVRGVKADGHDFLPAAAAAGAVACLLEEERPAPGLVRVRVPDGEEALGRAAAAFWGHPSGRLKLVGITGTNGKTTAAYLLQHLLRQAGTVTGRLGTVSYDFPSGEEPAPLTTPDAPTLQRALARMLRDGAEAVVMEVSSHALHRKRVEGCRFSAAVFTNLTQDHLDYHGTMEAYFEAKQLLFDRYRDGAPAVVNGEDPWGRRLLESLPAPAVSFGLQSGDVRVEVREAGAWGMKGTVHHPGGACPLELPLAGEFNVRNAAAALATAAALDLDVASAAAALAHAPQVPGRLEAVPNRRDVSVYVDYAHTPDALDRVLEAVAPLTRGRLLCLFGCGGDRDRGKRPHMARAAARWCDAVVLTADNSRSEPTEAILDEIEAGMPADWCRVAPGDVGREPFTYARVSDRSEAIRTAVGAARPGDTVVLAGKGHESTQTIGRSAAHFDDREEARRALAGGEDEA
ncbi:MAG: UDP-N-acetylmuramoyl-L-alanyl-D-glutamate--2,6-diaminopimelate ligase [Deltaproteobacteria bacterium]|nr:UDP-N-acetylmuramoyl-L-alanyl-D-glutamate--2,6-diaminopimelate ligase [Deltaproteobacteria bacterium]